MSKNFNESFKKSTLFFEENKQKISSYFHDFCELYSIELDSKNIASMLDMYAGVDYLLVDKKNKHIYCVAARVNFWRGTHGHLTIRCSRKNGTKTEYEKRLKSILNGSLYPKITIQVDSANGNLTNGIILFTDEFYAYIENNKDYFFCNFMKTCNEGNNYLSIPYTEIAEFGIRAKILTTIL